MASDIVENVYIQLLTVELNNLSTAIFLKLFIGIGLVLPCFGKNIIFFISGDAVKVSGLHCMKHLKIYNHAILLDNGELVNPLHSESFWGNILGAPSV